MIDQFFWEATNRRTDRYGGDLAGRTRFAVEVIEEIRRKVSPSFPVVLRFSQWKQQDRAFGLPPSFRRRLRECAMVVALSNAERQQERRAKARRQPKRAGPTLRRIGLGRPAGVVRQEWGSLKLGSDGTARIPRRIPTFLHP